MSLSRYVSRIDGHALVLGGSGGLGSEIVRAVVANGASAVSFTYGRNRQAAEKLADELRALGVKPFIAPLDQSDEASTDRTSWSTAAIASRAGRGPGGRGACAQAAAATSATTPRSHARAGSASDRSCQLIVRVKPAARTGERWTTRG